MCISTNPHAPIHHPSPPSPFSTPDPSSSWLAPTPPFHWASWFDDPHQLSSPSAEISQSGSCPLPLPASPEIIALFAVSGEILGKPGQPWLQLNPAEKYIPTHRVCSSTLSGACFLFFAAIPPPAQSGPSRWFQACYCRTCQVPTSVFACDCARCAEVPTPSGCRGCRAVRLSTCHTVKVSINLSNAVTHLPDAGTMLQ